jgi:AraC-like DNA-binding protein
MTFRFALNPRWTELPHCSALLNARSGNYVVDDYRTTLSIKTVTRGKVWYSTPQGRYLVTPETFLLLNHDRHYSMEVDASWNTETFCPFFQRGFVESVAGDGAVDDDVQPRPVEFCERLYPMAGRTAQALRAMRTLPLEDAFFELAEALIELRDGARRESNSFPGLRSATREEMYRRLYRARDFLYSCYAEPLTVSDAAGVAALSLFHFQRMFKQAFGISAMQFLQRRRLEVARQLLTISKDDVTSICLAVGFQSLGSFSALFKRRFALPPTQLRTIGEASAGRRA